MPLDPGSCFGPYRIVGPIGRGGMASVYEAYEAVLDRRIALKVLPAEFLHQVGFAQRFEREAKVIAGLEHPSIIPIFAFGIDEGIPWMSMRLLKGGSLATRLAAGLLEPARILEVLGSVADALDHAHSRGILHRDVKPQNVLLDEAGRAYLADFGIARLVEGKTLATATGAVSGTPQYMAPEQARGEKLDGRCDVYALGVVTYELLTGRVPFAAETPIGVLMKHITDPVPRPRPDEVPDALLDPVLKSLAKDPQERWESAGAFVSAVAAGFSEVPQHGVATRPAPSAPPKAASEPRSTPELAPTVADTPRPAEPPGETLALSSAPASTSGSAAPAAPENAVRSPSPSRRRWSAGLGALVVLALGVWGWQMRGDVETPAGAARAAGTEADPATAPPADVPAEGAAASEPYVEIPAGTFWMGCVPGDGACDDDERPRHRVTLSRPFLLGRTEVTVAEFEDFVRATGYGTTAEKSGFSYEWADDHYEQKPGLSWRSPGFPQGPRHPVTHVSWHDAVAYCEWAGGRLPTEAEWVRAARGGHEGLKYIWGDGESPAAGGGPRANVADEAARHRYPGLPTFPGYDDGFAETAPVASFPPNPYGLHDMAGNVWEWCADAYGPYAASPATDPRGIPSGKHRVLRGGAWDRDPWPMRLSNRYWTGPEITNDTYGFRCARDVSD